MPSITRDDFEYAVDMVLKSFTGVEKLNQHQNDALFELLRRRDVFAILPTGFGKSVIFQLLPSLCRELNSMGYNSFPENAIVLVICPLVALIESHMNELSKRGISCACVSGEQACQDKSGVLYGKYSFVFANPESIIMNEKWREMLQSSIYHERLFAVVTDEAHVIPKW
jgi:ATP-dependent DNA helicase RecQ